MRGAPLLMVSILVGDEALCIAKDDRREADRQQQAAQLRAQMFADSSEALRAYVTDVAATAGRAEANSR